MTTKIKLATLTPLTGKNIKQMSNSEFTLINYDIWAKSKYRNNVCIEDTRTKFKAGDKVRQIYTGEIWTVDYIQPWHKVYICHSNRSYNICWDEYALEAVD